MNGVHLVLSHFQDHAYHENFQASPSLHRPPIDCLHFKEQLQRTGTPYALPRHGGAHFLKVNILNVSNLFFTLFSDFRVAKVDCFALQRPNLSSLTNFNVANKK